MEKKKIYGDTTKEQLKAGAKDKMYNFLINDGKIRGALVHSTKMVNEMRSNHELGILETLVLGHAYMGATLMTASLKGNDRLALKIECSGPINGLSVEANAFGEVRGYLNRNPIPIDKPLESFNLSPFFGAGFLSVTKYLEDSKQPFTGKVMLQHGNIAQDLASYYLTSEQTPTAFDLSIKFDTDGIVTGAGGLFLQAMPDAEENDIIEIEKIIKDMPSIGEAFADEKTPEKIINKRFKNFSPKIIGSHRVEFLCRCNRERIYGFMAMMPQKDLKDILDKGPFPVTTTCHNCNTVYTFTEDDIRKMHDDSVKRKLQ